MHALSLQTLAKVLCAVVKFDPEQQQEIVTFQQSQSSAVSTKLKSTRSRQSGNAIPVAASVYLESNVKENATILEGSSFVPPTADDVESSATIPNDSGTNLPNVVDVRSHSAELGNSSSSDATAAYPSAGGKGPEGAEQLDELNTNDELSSLETNDFDRQEQTVTNRTVADASSADARENFEAASK